MMPNFEFARNCVRFACVGLLASSVMATEASELDFSKSFSPNPIGPGSTTTLTFTITNNESAPGADLMFTDTLPGGMSIAAPSSAFTDCPNADLSAPDGGMTISLLAGASATLTVDGTKPGLSKAFSPSTLTFTVSNGGGVITSMNFTDVLPAGMIIATPPNVSTYCFSAALTAIPGTSTIPPRSGAFD